MKSTGNAIASRLTSRHCNRYQKADFQAHAVPNGDQVCETMIADRKRQDLSVALLAGNFSIISTIRARMNTILKQQ